MGDDLIGIALRSPGVIERASAKEFKPSFNAYISQEAQVITDEWKGYLPLMKDYKKLEQRPSNKGANFKELHIHIMNIQGWLRGIHQAIAIKKICKAPSTSIILGTIEGR